MLEVVGAGFERRLLSGHILRLEVIDQDYLEDILTLRGLQDPRVRGSPFNSSRHR
jgi:hypothetical protein